MYFEPVGGLCYLSGQNAMPAPSPYHGRVSRTYVSSDFVMWSPSSAISHVRPQQYKLLGPGRSREGEQDHEGISVWNRGNVLLGVSGRWHGAKKWDGVTVDLGFVLSNDGIRFRPPAHEWTFLNRGKDGAWNPRAWQKSPPRGGVDIATLPRDRFADFRVDESTKSEGNYQMLAPVSEFLTTSFSTATNNAHRFHVNAHGLGPASALKFELLNHVLTPVKGYAAVVRKNDFQTPIVWPPGDRVKTLPQRFRLRVTFLGTKKTDIRFHAVYVGGLPKNTFK